MERMILLREYSQVGLEDFSQEKLAACQSSNDLTRRHAGVH